MKYIFVVAAFVFCGCSVNTAKLPQSQSSKSAILYFSEPGQGKVRVFAIDDFKGGGSMVTDFSQIAEPQYLNPGEIRVTFGCTGDKEFSYSHFTMLTLPKAGTYNLYCNSQRLLGVRSLKLLPN